MISAQTTQQ